MAIADAVFYAAAALPAIAIAWYLQKKKKWPEKRAVAFGEWVVLGIIFGTAIAVTIAYS